MFMKNYKQIFDELKSEASKVIVGQESVIEQISIAILCEGNALLEGYPGVAKTTMVKTISELMELKFNRIQNTPDLMPSDITGTYIIEEVSGKRQFKFQPGPVFSNVLLADEINRATPKTQSALLEAMQEKQVTVGTNTFKLDLPFFVLATQNPIEQEGSLELNQTVFINGQLKTGNELLALAHNCIAEDKKGIKLYEINGWTFALNTSGKLEKQKCLLYTLPYKDKMVSITTKTGKRLVVTKNHPFLVNENGTIGWKKADELTKNDYLVCPAKLPFIEHEIMSHEEASSKMTQKSIQKILFDEDFAFWSAFLLSAGSIGEKYIEAVQKAVQKNYSDALERFVAVSKKYGFSPKVTITRGCRYARIYSKSLVEYLSIRFNIKHGKNKEIPSCFLSFPPEINREFLKTFISLKSSLEDDRIIFTQKNLNNVNILSYMLLREGIIPWISHDGRIFRVTLQVNDFIKFLQNVGWLDKNKIKSIKIKKFNEKIKSDFRVVPVSKKIITRLVSLLGLDSFNTPEIKEGKIVMSVDSLQKMIFDIEESLKEQFCLRINEVEKLLIYFKQLLSEDIFYDKIKKIEYKKSDGTDTAFGLTVPGLKNYIAGLGGCGINHNTYPLPEAQADRFLLKINVPYPTYDQELHIVDRYTSEINEKKLKVILNKNHIIALQSLTRQVPVANDLKQRAVKIVFATRTNQEIIHYGASPRASIGLILAAKARALIQGRNHVSNEDINMLAYPILRHRIILNFEAERKGISKDEAIKNILERVK